VSDEGDETRSAWVFRYDQRTKRMFMAMETGLFAVDFPTSVGDNRQQQPTLSVRYRNRVVSVTDAAPRTDDRQWVLFDLHGRTVAAGTIDASMTCSTSALAAGTYVLTWGNERRFRTASFVVTP
jgi:hypothetical protein